MWQTSFQDKLRIRFANHHAKCGQRLKHRLIIKKLGHCPAAQRLQSTMLQSHLRRQHADREIYWSARARSRIDSVQPQVFHLCGIIDSMDQQKHSWPRSRTLLAKDFVDTESPEIELNHIFVSRAWTLSSFEPSYCPMQRKPDLSDHHAWLVQDLLAVLT